jgi:hypothetical protein
MYGAQALFVQKRAWKPTNWLHWRKEELKALRELASLLHTQTLRSLWRGLYLVVLLLSTSAECRSTSQPGYTSLVKRPINWDLHNASYMGRDLVLIELYSTCTIFDIIFIRYLNDHALYYTVSGVACTARYFYTVQAIRYWIWYRLIYGHTIYFTAGLATVSAQWSMMS